MNEILLSIVTLIGGFLSSYALNVQKENQAVKRRLQEKDVELERKLKEKDEQLNQLQNQKIGLLIDNAVATTRIHIIDYHDKYMAQRWMPLYAKDNLKAMYGSYHDMGGNGIMTKFYEDMLALPETEPK